MRPLLMPLNQNGTVNDRLGSIASLRVVLIVRASVAKVRATDRLRFPASAATERSAEGRRALPSASI
jgi:hypothetical protein